MSDSVPTLDLMALSDVDRAMLDMEGQTWPHPGVKEDLIRERFDLSPTRYYQRLNALLRREDALAYAPVTVNRLRRLRRVG